MPIEDAPVAQLDRASDYGSEGCKFESCRVRHLTLTLVRVFFITRLSLILIKLNLVLCKSVGV